jgi:radical SAM superfamily enzyme YgiQ (UPF0313 family)
MPEIVLATLNAKYIHSAFGLRYLKANIGGLESRTEILEFDINTRPADIAEEILRHAPRILGLGVYIWNTAQTLSVIQILKKVRPDLVLVLGGPEVSYETEGQAIAALADYIICGEADHAFRELCEAIMGNKRPLPKVLQAPLPDLSSIRLPYGLYSDSDLAHRVVYVEASRGCPFSCEFCLSSVEVPVRQLPRAPLLSGLDRLLQRGATQLKFVDRTFNLSVESSLAILTFLRQRYRPGLFFHFEVVPDRLPAELKEAIAQFPPGALQLEAGVQTFNEDVARRISRRQNYTRLEENLKFLRSGTGAHVHADLIAGLPGESMESFAGGFDRLVALGPQEIQVGILKRLKGTPIIRHDAEWQMTYNPDPPFELLKNRDLKFQEVQQLKRFARFWDLVGNSGNFIETAPLLWRDGKSPYKEFSKLAAWCHHRFRRTDSIALVRLMEALHEYLTAETGLNAQESAAALWRDYQRAGRREKPEFLRAFALAEPVEARRMGSLPKRQARHLGLEANPAATCGSQKPEYGQSR